ncbi:MAG TPA: 16S rRNA (guanine(966)-N(2))-methyltransferase RsmD [Spirochaetota bacterium]|jgi:16S rRNA (guanine(966)-N(2))-methyltransferase RsmD|nr:16S rRNA (guanine(966)-N(2))-methyltransferase RsmD [Spirochaetota bacterium]HOK91198.1 16S rRNA (guanine(966)-N(2))-methyltransferase RsmD [Spirochaetota bacterium]HON15805.1 16S rRNA (guanine(966)-N(2))-methyltransferase RsmD [Spirochaetota bacterium]HOQ12748.1 16S rRNA (guanine(966)-N(2))-methyltransferase RsmD [Spirochaetota bacterium]HPD77543.1 16S rRNA (guanine(966)-N(2))-methyltransferase RsmD [Spirochaetota bacterium]
MKHTIRVISGNLKGRVIPFLSKFPDADITPQKVKGALFSILGEDLSGDIFFDLFSGSGQIGIEALSRGASKVIFNEKDKARYSFIKEYIQEHSLKDNSLILPLTWQRAIDFVKKNGITVDIVFADPPYIKDKKSDDFYTSLVSTISQANILSQDGVVIVQHFTMNKLAQDCKLLHLVESKKYGTTTLSIYRIKE